MQQIFRSILIRWSYGVMIAALWLTGCAPSATSQPDSASPLFSTVSSPQLLSTFPVQSEAFSDIPPEARAATRRGDPRPATYWALWNTCAQENRATQAAANGGRAAGWILMDDLIAKPGIQLGDYQVMTCAAGLSLLQGRTAAGEATDDPMYSLAAALLAAELNLNVGAETCPIAEEAVLGGHLVFSSVGFTGNGEYDPSDEITSAIPRLIELLTGYNRGELCQ